MSDRDLDRWLRELSDAGSPEPPGDLKGAVLARLDDAEGGGAEDDWLFRAEAETSDLLHPDTLSVTELLAMDVAEAVSSRSWPGFGEGVMVRLDAEPAPGLDPLRPDALVPVEVWLRAETDRELARMEGKWTAFSTQILHQLDAPPAATLDQQAVDLLRADVDDEVQAMGPSFEGRFEAGVGRRIQRPADQGWLDWLRARVPVPVAGAGLGLAAAAAVVMLAVWTEPGPVGVPADAAASVTVDSVSFEGDIVVIPDEEVTMVVLSGV